MHPLRIMLLAGENSGDLHAAHLLEHLRPLLPGDTVYHGYGGTRMAAQGMTLHRNLAQDLPIIGLTQAIRHLPALRRLMREAVAHLASSDLLILVDYPGFNLRLAAHARRLGVPVVYYIAPQVWAWKKNRLQTIAKTVDLVLTILPFEAPLYSAAGVAVQHVGHPLADDLQSLLREPRSQTAAPQIALIPGSRTGEVRRHLPIMLVAAALIHRVLPTARFIIPHASTVPLDDLTQHTALHPELPLTIAPADGPAGAALRARLDYALCKSGTSTLELALAGVPHLIVYKASALTAFAARRVLKIRWLGLTNIIADRTIAPEFLQERATAAALAQEALRILKDSSAHAAAQADLAEVAHQLGAPGASARAAQAVAGLLKARGKI